MTLLAISTHALWWITLGVGLVVALVVWTLLEMLRRAVNQVDESVEAVWTMGKRLAQNTATTHTLQATKTQGVQLLEELERHRPSGEGSAS